MALSIYVRYSAVFFVAGVGSGVFLYLVFYERSTLARLFGSLTKLGLMMLVPALAFVHLMFRTSQLIGTFDRYSGTRVPESLLSTLWLWAANSAELLGFGMGYLFRSGYGVAIFVLFACLVAGLLIVFFYRTATGKTTLPTDRQGRFIWITTAVTLLHVSSFVGYLTLSSMSSTPLEIVNRYLYQIYFGIYLLFCLVVFCLMSTTKPARPGKRDPVVYLPLGAIISIYLIAQLNELSTSRNHFFEESRAATEVMQVQVTPDTTLRTHIDNCLSQFSDAVIWSTHGQHVHFHTGRPTITHLPIYSMEPFDAVTTRQKIDEYGIEAFLFIDQPAVDEEYYRDYMNTMKQWLTAQGYSSLVLPPHQILGDRTVDVMLSVSACRKS